MMRVLVVDDDPGIRFTVRVALEGAPFPEEQDMEVVEAADGAAALTAIATERFDIVVLDVMMPNLDGMQVLRTVRRQRGDDVAIVMLTAKGRESDVAGAFRAGADGYLTKPFDVDELTDAVLAIAAAPPAERRARRHAELQRAELLLQLEHGFGDLPLQ